MQIGATHKLNKRQDLILEYLSDNNSYSVADILKYLYKKNKKVSRITVVRDMRFLLKENFLVLSGAGRAVKYTLSPRYNLIKNVDIEKYFSVLQDDRKIKKHFNFDIFNILKNDIFSIEEKKMLTTLNKEFLQNFKKIKSKTLISKEFERIIIEFSWKSSQIEGNTYSLLDTEVLIKENKVAAGKTKEETQMILNQKKAFYYILKHQNEYKILSQIKIEELHQILTHNLGITKNLRSKPVGITGTNYKPIDNIFQITEAMEKTIKLINNKKDFFEKSFLSLILLSYAQPFEDGNKRTARLISNAILLAHGSIPISYRVIDEVEYKKAVLLFYEQNNLNFFKELFIQQFEFAVKTYFR